MCGIAGTFGIRDTNALKSMLESLAHRGPDDSGEYHDSENTVFLGHRRLSIVDLSPRGHQPMSDEAGDIWVTYNGEIYNYKELRAELERNGFAFNSDSDTEVLIHGYKAYGTDIFQKIIGMWAVALYDKKEKKLILSRDPGGMKPLYVFKDDSRVFFASEIGALAQVLHEDAKVINDEAVSKFIAHGYIYGSGTVYQKIVSLPPATTRVYSLPDLSTKDGKNYVSPTDRSSASFDEAVESFEKVFKNSVQMTLQADVPVGIFLSGGVDSALVAHQVKNAGATLQAFTVGFGEKDFDESSDARKIAEHFNFPHTVATMQGADVARDVEKILTAFGEPFGDTSALPTYYLSKLARESGYKVALTGDGADELFGGYPTHYLPEIVKMYRHVPAFSDTILATVAGMFPTKFTKLGLQEKISRYLHGARLPYRDAHAQWKRVFTDKELKLLMISRFESGLASDRVPDFDEFFDAVAETSENIADEVMKVDFQTFLASDCLVKSDIAGMQHAIEIRAPFLNREMMDLAWTLPTRMKVSPFRTKKILRSALARELPGSISRLPKRGFVPPLSEWLTDALKPAMLELLSRRSVEKTRILRYTYVEELINEHLSRRSDNSKKLWCLMSLCHFYSLL